MSNQRRASDTERRLRRRDRAVFPGNPTARSAVARPVDPNRILSGGGGGGGAGGVVPPGGGQAELIRWRVDAEDVPDSGHTVVFDTEVCRYGFPTTGDVGDTLILPYDGFYFVTVAVFFAGAYTGGALVDIYLDRGEPEEDRALILPVGGFGGSSYGETSGAFCGFAGSVLTVSVAQTSGVTQTADVRLDLIAFRSTLYRPGEDIDDVPPYDPSIFVLATGG